MRSSVSSVTGVAPFFKPRSVRRRWMKSLISACSRHFRAQSRPHPSRARTLSALRADRASPEEPVATKARQDMFPSPSTINFLAAPSARAPRSAAPEQEKSIRKDPPQQELEHVFDMVFSSRILPLRLQQKHFRPQVRFLPLRSFVFPTTPYSLSSPFHPPQRPSDSDRTAGTQADKTPKNHPAIVESTTTMLT